MRAIGFATGLLVCAQPVFAEPLLTFPVDCTLGETCFVQQLVDMDPGPDARDAVCGFASYNGHTGTDIRTAQVVDLGTGGRVVAAMDGTVRAVRNDEPDRLVESEGDRASISGRECGNGVLIDHAQGYQTQYCHLAQQSVLVAPGDEVLAGQALGSIGLSGLTQFPHLEFIVRRNGEVLDPFSGRSAGDGCGGELTSLWQDPNISQSVSGLSQFIGAGLSAAPIDHDTLMFADPLPLFEGATAVVGWGWAINVEVADVFQFSLTGPDGFAYTHTSDPVPRNQAAYSSFAGARFEVRRGEYSGTIQLVRAGAVIDEETISVVVD